MMTHKDKAGQVYTTSDGKPAAHGVAVKLQTSTGPTSGTMVGGIVQPDKPNK